MLAIPMLRRLVRLALLGCVLGLGFAGAQKVSLTYWHGFTGPDLPVMEQLVAAFNAAHADIEVTAEPIAWGNLFQQLEPAVAAGRAPDVVALNEDVLAGFALRGALAEVTPDELVANSIDAARFYPGLWQTGIVNDKVYGVPVHSVMLVMYYNKALFAQAGLDPEAPPQTREAYLEAARRLTMDGQGRHPGDDGFDPADLAQWAAGIPTPWMGGTIAYSVAAQNGVNFVGSQADGYPANFDSEGGRDAIQFLVDLVNEYHVSPANATEASEIDAFRGGKAAINLNGVWMLSQYREQTGLDFGVAPFPQLGTQEYKVWGGSSHLALPVQRRPDAAKQRAALQFVAWMTRPEQDLTWTTAGSLPTQAAVTESEGYASNPMTAAASALPHTFVLTGFPFIAQLRSAWDAAFEAALLGKKDVPTALADGVAEANSRIQDALQGIR